MEKKFQLSIEGQKKAAEETTKRITTGIVEMGNTFPKALGKHDELPQRSVDI